MLDNATFIMIQSLRFYDLTICNGVTCIPNARQAFQILILSKNLNKKFRTELYFHVINSKKVGGMGCEFSAKFENM